MASIQRDDLARFLGDHLGTAALRELRAQLIAEGTPLDQVQGTQEERLRDFAPSKADHPRQRFAEDMRQLVDNIQYDLSHGPQFLAQYAARLFSSVARADGSIHQSDVETRLGKETATAFQLLLDSVGQAGKVREPAAPKKRALPDNALGTKLPSPDREPFVIPRELIRRIYFQMRTVHPQLFQKLMEKLADRDLRRDPVTRISAAWDQEVKVPRPAGLEPLRAEAAESQLFAGCKVIALQHLYASTVSIFEALGEGGMRPEDLTVLGKPYSGAPSVAAEILRRGHRLSLPSLRQSEYADNEAYSRSLIEEQVRRLLAEDPQGKQPILVLDDGAQIAKVVHDLFPSEAHRFRFVEQTTKGSNLLRRLGLDSVAVDVGTCPEKKIYESPSIAHSVMHEMRKVLDRLQQSGVDVPKSICVLGAGSIGGAVLTRMRQEGWAVHVFDPGLEHEARQALLRQGVVLHGTRAEALAHGHVVLGTSGSEAFGLDDHQHLPSRSIFINAASGNNELNGRNLLLLNLMNASSVQAYPDLRADGMRLPRHGLAQLDTATQDEQGGLWDFFGKRPVYLGDDHNVATNDRVIHLRGGKEIYVVKSGFVVNLTDDQEPIPARYIGLTRSLLFAALMQAVRSNGRGVEDLDPTVAERVRLATEADLAKTGESLLNPEF